MTPLLSLLLLAQAEPLKPPVPTHPEHTAKVKQAVSLHDRGEYAAAAALYGEILAENPGDTVALFELSYSQFAKKDYDACIATTRRGLTYDSRQRPGFFTNLGSCLDAAGRPQEAVEIYQQGIAAFPEHALLHYNLGVTHQGQQNFAAARKAFQQSLRLNPRHASSHLQLADIYARSGYRVPSLLAATYFLVLEPDSRRSPVVAAFLLRTIQGSVEQKGKNIAINLNVNAPKDEGDFQGADLMLMMSAAIATGEKSKKKTAREHLAGTYRVLVPQQKSAGFAAEFYVPFLQRLNEKHLDVFAARLLRDRDEEARKWLAKHSQELAAFEAWAAAEAGR